jgi:glycosyltransferase involved in cell wall biosynthesis
VVVTRVGAAREYFGPLCQYVDPADPADIARGIHAALAAGPQAALRSRVAETFTWPVVTAALPDVYRTAVARRNQRRGGG